MRRVKPYDRNQSSRRYTCNRPSNDRGNGQPIEDGSLTVFSRRFMKKEPGVARDELPPIPTHYNDNWADSIKREFEQDLSFMKKEPIDLKKEPEFLSIELPPFPTHSGNTWGGSFDDIKHKLDQDVSLEEGLVEDWSAEVEQEDLRREFEHEGREEMFRFPNSSSMATGSDCVQQQRWHSPMMKRNERISHTGREVDGPHRTRNQSRGYSRGSYNSTRDYPRRLQPQNSVRGHPRGFPQRNEHRGSHSQYEGRGNHRGLQPRGRGGSRGFKSSHSDHRNFQSQDRHQEAINSFSSMRRGGGGDFRNNFQSHRPNSRGSSIHSRLGVRGDHRNFNSDGRGDFNSPDPRQKFAPNLASTPGSSMRTRTSTMSSSTSTQQSDMTTPKKRGTKKKVRQVETDPVVIKRREKQLDKGKNTIVYENYIKAVPKDSRTKYHLRTPDKTRIYSRRHWESVLKNWRIQLHEWKQYAEEKRGTYIYKNMKKGEKASADKKEEKDADDPDDLNLDESEEESDDDIEFIDNEIFEQDPDPADISLYYLNHGDETI